MNLCDRLCVLYGPRSNSNGFKLPVRKYFFGTRRKRYIDHHFCMSFSLRECISRQNRKSVYQGKNVMCISGQVYYTKNYKKNGFYEPRLSYKGEKWWTIDPSGKPQFEFEGGDTKYTKTVIKFNSQYIKMYLEPYCQGMPSSEFIRKKG